MAEYHKYVFDQENRKFIGKFEKMYLTEHMEGFDSWHQEDQRDLSKQIILLLLKRYNFNKVLDVGCGKGSFTHQVKKVNNQVTGIDISKTAIRIAQKKFPDVNFECVNLGLKLPDLPILVQKYDLILFMEILSYLQNWQELLQEFIKLGDYFLISLFIPENPIGFVKSPEELGKFFKTHFEVIEEIQLLRARKTILFGKSLQSKRRCNARI
jgi:SAM-dependent methyltransferase